jgi:hypothetical protein
VVILAPFTVTMSIFTNSPRLARKRGIKPAPLPARAVNTNHQAPSMSATTESSASGLAEPIDEQSTDVKVELRDSASQTSTATSMALSPSLQHDLLTTANDLYRIIDAHGGIELDDEDYWQAFPPHIRNFVRYHSLFDANCKRIVTLSLRCAFIFRLSKGSDDVCHRASDAAIRRQFQRRRHCGVLSLRVFIKAAVRSLHVFRSSVHHFNRASCSDFQSQRCR